MAEPIALEAAPQSDEESPKPIEQHRGSSNQKAVTPPSPRTFTSFWELAVALNRSDPAALALARAEVTPDISLDGTEVKRLLGMMWFRPVFGHLSPDWRERLLHVLIESTPVPDRAVKRGRRTVHLHELGYAEFEETRASAPEWMRPDLDLLIAVSRFWGADALKRFRFVEVTESHHEPSAMESLLHKFRE